MWAHRLSLKNGDGGLYRVPVRIQRSTAHTRAGKDHDVL